MEAILICLCDAIVNEHDICDKKLKKGSSSYIFSSELRCLLLKKSLSLPAGISQTKMIT